MRVFVVSSILILVMSLPSLCQALEPVGHVKNTRGDALILRLEQSIQAVAGTEVLPGDVLLTGKQASMGVVFKDNTLLSLGPDTKLQVNEFVFRPRDKEFSFFARLFQGTAEYVSGLIGKLSPEAVRFETPVANLGLRGTSFLARVEPEQIEGRAK